MQATTRRRTLFGLAAILIAFLALPVTAGLLRPGPAAGLRAGGIVERAATRLDLTAEQRDEIRELIETERPEILARSTAVLAARRNLEQAVHTHPPDPNQVDRAAHALGLAQGEMAWLRAELGNEVYQVLDAEQQTELAEIREDLSALVETLVENVRDRILAFS